MKKIIITSVISSALIIAGALSVATKVNSQALITSETAVNPLINLDVLNLLGRLEATQIDGAFFESPLFSSLEDFSLEVVDEPLSRPNPFAPIGSDAQ